MTCLNVEFSTHPLSCLLLQIKISGLFNGVSYDNRRQMTPLGLDIITSKLATKLKSWTMSFQTNNGSCEIECVRAEPHVTSTPALSGNKTCFKKKKKPRLAKFLLTYFLLHETIIAYGSDWSWKQFTHGLITLPVYNQELIAFAWAHERTHSCSSSRCLSLVRWCHYGYWS